jgi:hypothetical protein
MKDLILKWTAVEDLTEDQKKECCTHDHLGIVNIKYPASEIVDKKVAPVILVGSILRPEERRWVGVCRS